MRSTALTPLFVLLLTLFGSNAQAAAKQTVCHAMINSHDELDIFKAHLNPNDFEFVDLIELGGGAKGWFDAACKMKVNCDIVLVSGHFMGSFTGTRPSLPLATLEKHQCDQDCAGILDHPSEVFLFGCNALADKRADFRVKDKYTDVLIEHAPSFSRVEREKVVETRYGMYGDSYGNRSKHAFSGTANVYGFWSVDPLGSQMAPFLESYFKDRPNYTDWIQQIQASRVMQQFDTLQNDHLQKDFGDLNFLQCGGMRPKDPDFEVRTKACILNNSNVSVAEKLSTIRSAASGEDFHKLLPEVSKFLADNPAKSLKGEDLEAFKKIASEKSGKKSLDAVIVDIYGHQLKLDMIDLGGKIGWYSSKERSQLRYQELKRSLNLSLEEKKLHPDKNLLCDLTWEPGETKLLKVQDLKDEYFTLSGLASLACVKPASKEVQDKVLALAVSKNADVADAASRVLQEIPPEDRTWDKILMADVKDAKTDEDKTRLATLAETIGFKNSKKYDKQLEKYLHQ